MRLSSCLALVASAAISTAAPGVVGVEAKAKPGVSPQALGETNLITSRGAASVLVRIPNKARVWHPWADKNKPDFEIQSSATFVAFALVREDQSPRFTMLVGGRLPKEALSAPFLSGLNLGPKDPRPGEVLLEVPPGTYRLHLLSDKPVRLTMRFDGLRGDNRLAARDPTGYDIKYPQRFPETGPVQNFYSAGETGTLQSRGVQMQVYWRRDIGHASSHQEFCWYDDVPPDDRIAYLPPCLMADGTAGTTFNVVSMGDFLEVAEVCGDPSSPVEVGRGSGSCPVQP